MRSFLPDSALTTVILAVGLISAASSAQSAGNDAAAVAPVESPGAPDPTTDPYTRGEAETLARVGYESLGPFAIGSYHGTAEIAAALGPGRMLWIETPHFKLGAELPPYSLRGLPREQRDKLRTELRELKTVLPRVDVDCAELDPWLRAHLLARRCERTYADFLRIVGFADSDFGAVSKGVSFDDNWMGRGRYLGQHKKFVVLVFAHSLDFRRYAHEHLGLQIEWPQRYDLGHDQSLLFGTALDFEGGLTDDTALHCHVAYSLLHNFCDGYRSLLFETPVWFKTGLAQWYTRRIDPRHPNYDRPPDRRPDGRAEWDWAPRVKGLVEHDAARPFAEMATWRDYGPFRFHDYIVAWSRVDFLMSLDAKGFARFLHRVKAPLWRSLGTNDWDKVLAQQERAISEGWGFTSLDDLDQAWQKWVRTQRADSQPGADEHSAERDPRDPRDRRPARSRK